MPAKPKPKPKPKPTETAYAKLLAVDRFKFRFRVQGQGQNSFQYSGGKRGSWTARNSATYKGVLEITTQKRKVIDGVTIWPFAVTYSPKLAEDSYFDLKDKEDSWHHEIITRSASSIPMKGFFRAYNSEDDGIGVAMYPDPPTWEYPSFKIKTHAHGFGPQFDAPHHFNKNYTGTYGTEQVEFQGFERYRTSMFDAATLSASHVWEERYPVGKIPGGGGYALSVMLYFDLALVPAGQRYPEPNETLIEVVDVAGHKPLSGIEVVVGYPDGSKRNHTTTANGTLRLPSTKGTYTVHEVLTKANAGEAEYRNVKA